METKNYSLLLFTALFLLLPFIGISQQAGTIDRSFNYGFGPNAQFNLSNGANGDVTASLIQPNGKIIAIGNFTMYNGSPRQRLVFLNADGSLDNTYSLGTGANNMIRTIVMQPDGKMIIGGDFTSYNGISRNRIARLNADGSLDASFNPGVGANNSILNMALQQDGRIVIAGDFSFYNGVSRNRIARINTDGSLDISFNPGLGANNNRLEHILLLPEGKMIISGNFTSFNGTRVNQIARLNVDGNLDAGFNSGSGVSGSRIEIAVRQPDGKILIGGPFTSYNGVTRNRVARLNDDGSLDPTFNPGSGATGYSGSSITEIALQPDGKMIVGGWFMYFNGSYRNNIARLNPNGSVDNTFDPGMGTDFSVYSIVLQPDGKLVVGGLFTEYNGLTIPRITRLFGDNCSLEAVPAITGTNSFCLGSSTILTSSILTGNLWSNGDTSRSIIVTEAGSYSVRSVQSTCTSAFSTPISVVALPSPAVPSIRATYDNLMHSDSTILSVINPMIGFNYEWSNGMFGTRIVVRNGENITVRAINNVTNCASAYSSPAYITHLKNGLPLPSFDLFPNPSNGVFTLKTAREGLKLQLRNTLGTKVADFTTQTGEQSIDISQLPNGVYFLHSQGFAPFKLIKK